VSQKKWDKLPISKKNNLRKMLPDRDKDGVPNKYDCRPKNKCKQESFLVRDSAYIRSTQSIMPGKFIDSSVRSEVFIVAGNKNMVIKVPKGYIKHDAGMFLPSARRAAIAKSMKYLQDEYDLYVKYDLENEALFSPTQLINLPQNDLGMTAIGLMRPYVKVINEDRLLTTGQLEALRQQMISISRKGLYLTDDLQIGIDKSGRVLLFDLDWIEKGTPSEAFDVNNEWWENLLVTQAHRRRSPPYDTRSLRQLYGSVAT
jgi:hypothetical protein